MKRTFENYLIMVGIRSLEYSYTDDEIMDNTEYFRKCYNDKLSAYKALLFLLDDKDDIDTSNANLNIPVVSQQSKLLNDLCDSIDKEFETYAYLPDLYEHIKAFNCG